MSSFYCEHCGKEILDSPTGYTTGCPHYPLETFKGHILIRRPSNSKPKNKRDNLKQFNKKYNNSPSPACGEE